jgi:anti-sigma factor (TIGR02949 family)
MTHEHTHCRELLASLSEYVDGSLDESLCEVIEQHMSECERCQIVVDTLRKTVELYRATASAPPMPDDVRARLFVRLNLADFLKDKGAPRADSVHEEHSEKSA